LEEFDSCVVFIKKPAPSCNAISKLAISRTVGSDKKASVRASIKLDAGDVKVAIRVLSSDAACTYSCTVSQLITAVKFFGPGSASGWDGLRPQHL